MSSPAKPLHKRLSFKILAAIFVLYCLIWVLSSPIIKHFAKEPLAEYGLTLSDSAHISYNPFLTRITVLDLALSKDNSTVLEAEHLVLQLALHKVPFKIIELEEFSIDGVLVKIDKNKNDLFVAGVNITPEKDESLQEEPQNEEPKNDEQIEVSTEPSPYEVRLDNLVISNTLIDALVDGYPHQFTIKNLDISDIQASQTQQSAKLALNSLLDDAEININAQLNLKNNEGLIESDLEVSKYSLKKIKHFIEPLESLTGELSLSSSQNITLASDGINLIVKNTELNTHKIRASTKNENINLETLRYTISDVALNLNKSAAEKDQPQINSTNKIDATIKNTQLTLSKLNASTKELSASLDDFIYSMQDVSVEINNDNIGDGETQKSSTNKVNALVKSTKLSTHNIKANTKEQSAILGNMLYSMNDLALDITQKELKTDKPQAIIENDISLSVKATEFSTKDISASTTEQRINLENLLYSMADFSVEMDQNELQKNLIKAINAKAEFVLTKALVEALPNELVKTKDETENTNLPKILSFEQLSLTNISPKLIPEPTGDIASDLSVMVDSLNLEELLFSQNTATDLPPIATIENINVSNIESSAKALAINEITIDTITSHIILNKEKVLANLVSISSSPKEEVKKEAPKVIEKDKTVKSDKKGKKKKSKKKEKPVEPASEPASKEPAFYISLNAFNVINSNRIDFRDNSVDPIYKRSLMIDTLSVGKLNNSKEFAQEKTPITLKGRSNQYANFAFDGFIQPFAKQKTYHLKGNLNELSLPDVSTYMKDALKLELKSGQLNTKLDITLIDDDIDGDVNININGLETAAANNDETNLVKDQVGIPFNVALGMLKDGNGDLILDVPLSGKTSSPSFGISSFIALITKKAVMSATQDYLMTTFVPYANIVSVAMTAGEFILKLRFEDLPYEPKQIELNEKQAVYIEQFAALMKDRKDTRVKICAISVPGDMDLPAGEKLSPENIKALKEIGDKREQAFKSKVVKEAEIESGRILLCTPQIDNKKDALPRMVISV